MEDNYAPPPIPEGLGDAGGKLWVSITRDFELTGSELRLLLDACGEADIIAEMDRVWVSMGRPFTASGSRGQDVAHPIVSEIRQHRLALKTLLGSLRLPADDDDGVVVKLTPSQAGRKGAQIRWGNRGA